MGHTETQTSFAKANKKLKKYLPLITILSKATKKELKCILSSLNDDALDQISVCVFNCIHNTNFPPAEFKKLQNKIKKDKTNLRFIEKNVFKRGKARRKAIIQSGGSIGDILSTILPLVLSIII